MIAAMTSASEIKTAAPIRRRLLREACPSVMGLLM
jgi:hypothetical protein